MKCLVAVKRVIDFNVKVRIKSDGSSIDSEHLKMSMNPFDEIAMEEAVLQKEAGKISEIIAMSIGDASCQETLREALARGADRAILVETTLSLEPFNVAKILKILVEKEQCSLIILGKQAIDDDCNQTGQMLAGMLNVGQATNASKIQINQDNNTVEVTREIDRGLETLSLKLPAVITVDLRLNIPRYITLPNVMKAKNKTITKLLLKEDLHFEPKEHVKTLKMETPIMKRKKVMVASAQELLNKLKNEAKVIL